MSAVAVACAKGDHARLAFASVNLDRGEEFARWSGPAYLTID